MLKIEELQEGEIYKVKTNKYNIIFKFKSHSSGIQNFYNFIRIEDDYYSKYNCLVDKNFIWDNCNNEEKHWLNECIKANKFIPYEEAMKTFKEESLVGRYAKFKSNWNTLGNHYCYNPIDFNKAYKITLQGDYKFKNCSGKCVAIDEIYKLAWIPVEVLDIMPEGWTPEQEKPQYEVGKWYTHPKWFKGVYIKFHSIRDNNSVNRTEIISNGIFQKEISWSISYEHTLIPVDLSEIQQYLPDRHEDKFPIESKEFSILEQAKLKYPVGTKYELAHKPNEGIIHFITGDLKWGNDGNIYGVNFIDGEKHDGCVYYKGQWAKIITHEIPQKMNNSVPEYVECIDWAGFSHKKGQIYELKDGYVDCELGETPTKYETFKHNFIPSTKEAYEAQFKQYPLTPKECISNSNVIEIGDEVEVINDNNYNNGNKKIGDRFIVKLITKADNEKNKYWIHYLDTTGFGIGDKNLKITKKASQTTQNKKVDGISPVKVNTKLLDIIKIKGSAPTKVEKKRIKLTILKTKQLNLN